MSATDRPSTSRINKIYRTPSTPPPGELQDKEKGFVLDCQATSSISCDYSKTNPKLGPVIPPYNSQRDKHVNNYYQFIGVDETLIRTGQDPPGCSIEGPVADYFDEKGTGYQYLSLRNNFGAGHTRTVPALYNARCLTEILHHRHGRIGYTTRSPPRSEATGAGHSRELVDGHSQFMKGIKPVTGYNGKYGFRRNTPWLRNEPSPFGTATRSETH